MPIYSRRLILQTANNIRQLLAMYDLPADIKHLDALAFKDTVTPDELLKALNTAINQASHNT
jgi:hypothetical protein